MLSPGLLSAGWIDGLDPQLRRLRSSERDVNLERTPPPKGSGCDRCAVTEKFAFLDDLHYFRRNHPFPGAISRLQFGQCVGRINSQVLRMIIGDLFDVAIVD